MQRLIIIIYIDKDKMERPNWSRCTHDRLKLFASDVMHVEFEQTLRYQLPYAILVSSIETIPLGFIVPRREKNKIRRASSNKVIVLA